MPEKKPSKMRDELQDLVPWLLPFSQLQCRWCLASANVDVTTVTGVCSIRCHHYSICPEFPGADTDVDVTSVTGPMGPASWEG